MLDLGFRCLIGTSFGDIFFNNCFQQGILPVLVDAAAAECLQRHDGLLTVDLQAQQIAVGEQVLRFEVNPLRKRSLLEGRDDIDLTLALSDRIAAFRERDGHDRPWVYQQHHME